MATLPGRIRRISLDVGNPANYTLEATTSYNGLIPAESPSSWGDAAALAGMDQALSIPVPPAVEVIGNMGVLVTFNRFPEYFKGVVVKVKPTYDTGISQDPYLEFWTYNSVEAAWTIRRNVQLRNGFVGCPSGKVKYFDFRLDAPLADVTKFWVTLNEGVVSGPVLSWLAVHVFGSCRNEPIIDGNCKNDPTIDCKDPTKCEMNPESCETGIVDCTTNPEMDFCKDPTPEWPTIPPPDDGPIPPTMPPDFPLIDLCDPVAVAAYKELLTPEQLAFFTEVLAASELPCLVPIEDPPVRQPDPDAPINQDPDTGEKVLPKQPIEVYVDPTTLQPAPDPRTKDKPKRGPTPVTGLRTKRFILVWSGNDAIEAAALVTSDVAQIIGYVDPPVIADPQIIQMNWGPNVGVTTVGSTFSPSVYGLKVQLSGLPFVAQVGLRIQTLRLRGGTSLQDSINNEGIYVGAAAGGCLPQPDWILTRSSSLSVASRPLINESFYELYHANLFSTSSAAEITLELPRVDAAQNDATTCTGSFKARSRLGHQRSGCLVGFTAKLRQRWLYPFETALYDTISDPGDYQYHHRPYVIVVDVAIKRVADTAGFSVDSVGVTMDVTTLKDDQPIESCV